MSLVVKMVDGTQRSVDVPDLDITAAELKRLLAEVVNIPAEEQRVVVRGKVLKDGDVLRAIGVEHGHAVHVVRAKSAAKPAATTTTPSPTSTITPASSTTTTTATTAETPAPASTPTPANPYAGLMSGLFATAQPHGGGAATSPAAQQQAMLAALGGLPGGAAGGAAAANMNAQLQMLNTPGALEMMAQLAENPQFMEQMAQMNPEYANMPPEARQMTLAMMRNPELMRMMLSMYGGTGGAGGGDGGGGAAAALPQLGAGGGMPNLFMPSAAVAPPPVGNPREVYREQLAQLREMGFPNEDANIAALQQSQGNIHFAIERLFNA